MAAVKREDGRVWLDGVKGFSPGECASSVHGCMATIAATVGESITYDDLVCYGSFAFRVGLHEQMCPSAGHPCCGYMCVDGSVRALPWKGRVFEAFPWSPPKDDRAAFEAEARDAIRQTIDAGVPVHYGGEEDGLILGYADEGQRWLCMHPYHKGGRELFWHDEVTGFAGGSWPWAIVAWTEPKPAGERPDDRELTLAALGQAADMWQTEKREAYFCGEAAYENWLAWLGGVDDGSVADPAAGMQGNGWCFDVLAHSRRIAGRWLADKADLFGADAAGHLRAAAEHYAAAAEAVMKDLDCPWSLAPGPDEHEQWTPAMRRDQAARLAAARDHDRAAVAAIDRALAAMPEGTS